MSKGSTASAGEDGENKIKKSVCFAMTALAPGLALRIVPERVTFFDETGKYGYYMPTYEGNTVAWTETTDKFSDWITTADAARILGVTPRRVRQLIDENELVGRKITPRLLMVQRASVERYRQKVSE